MAKHEKTAIDEAFGIVPILRQDGHDRFLLIQHHAGHWGFPKGHADPGETAIATACREFVEETGITDYQVVADVSFVEQYAFTNNGTRYEKTVVYFPAWVQSELVTHQEAEIQASIWADYQTAIGQLTFKGSRQVLTQVHEYLQQQRQE
ncbi:MAG TPA: NUDIX domain-containing protein [Microcoleaceae cyanobacterium]|jgi:8-oxo-dGTP pyrophosphatase MutT (NUDIX family)